MNCVHCFSKLRLQSDLSLNRLDDSTTELGKSLRIFQKKVAIHYKTSELPKEVNARQRRKTAQNNKGKGKGKRRVPDDEGVPLEPRRKLFNLSTWKIHGMGYYTKFIRLFGTTDSYTTQTASFFHF